MWFQRSFFILFLYINGLPVITGQTPWHSILPNTNLRFPDQPKWLDYATKVRFPGLKFNQPVQLVFQKSFATGFFVVEKPGTVRLIPNRNRNESIAFLDLTDRVYSDSESGMLSLAFHPHFETNRRLFVYYCAKENIGGKLKRFNRLSEFKTSSSDPSKVLTSSEIILLNQVDQHADHNGGGMLFGEDGYLYLSLGDEGSFYDQFGNGQQLTKDFFAGILRLDVDQKPGNLLPASHPAASAHYAVPSDNPFVGIQSYLNQPLEASKLRSEFYAIGMRNPWRFAFDPLTGKLYSGDTGDHTREEINEIFPGGNYGWPHREGSLPGPPDHAIRNTDHGFIDPIAEYGREDGNDIAGLTVYRGTRFSELDGCVLFSDYYGGWLGKVRLSSAERSPIEWFARDTHVADIVTDPMDGNILLVDLFEGLIKCLVPPSENRLDAFPKYLSETGAFLDTPSFTVDPSFIPYELNVPFWSDHATKSRWVSFPSADSKIQFREEDPWKFPVGTVFMKHFDLELERGNPMTRKRLETRFLILNTLNQFFGVTYRWNEAQDDAQLVSPYGMELDISIREDDLDRSQKWHFPGRHECLACHNGGPNFLAPTRFGRYALGFNTAQLNREIGSGESGFNQIEAMNRAGILEPPLTGPITRLPKLVSADNEAASLGYRVRSYLAANCEACHEGKASVARLSWNATFKATSEQTKLIGHPAYNKMSTTEGRLIDRWDPTKSVLLQRLSHSGIERMPPIGSSEIDESAIDLIKRWILEDLKKPQSYEGWAKLYFADSEEPDAFLFADPDHDGVLNFFEAITLTNPLDGDDFYTIKIRKTETGVTLEVPGLTNRYVWIEWTETPNDESSWKFLNLPENAFFMPASPDSRFIEWEIPHHHNAFFRLKIRL